MEENYDKLDKFFKKFLNDHSEETWNVPDDRLFESAINQVPETKKTWKRRLIPLWWILGTSILGLVLIGLFFTQSIAHKTKLNSLEHKLSSVEQASNKNLALVEELILEIEALKQENREILESNDLLLKNASNQKFGHSNAKVKLPVNNDVVRNVIYQSVENEELDGGNVAFLDEKEDLITKKEILNSLNPANGLLFTLENRSTNVDEKFKLIEAPSSSSAKSTRSPWWISAGISNNWNWVSMTEGESINNSSITGYKKAQHSLALSLGLDYDINSRWRIESNVSYGRINIESESSYDMAYHEDNLEMVQGELLYCTPINLMNPLGEYSSEAQFSLSTVIQENDMMTSASKVRQRIHTLSTSIGPRYSIFENDLFSFGVRAGLSYNVNLSAENDFHSTIEYKGIVQFEQDESVRKLKKLNSAYFQAYSGLDVSYKVNEDLHIGLDMTYNRGLSSIRDSWPNKTPKTYLHSSVARFKISKRF